LRVVRPQLILKLESSRGQLSFFNTGARSFFYHGRVTNKKKNNPANNVRVLLVRAEKKYSDGKFIPANQFVPSQFAWAPKEISPSSPTISDYKIFDLFNIPEKGVEIRPSLYSTPNNFEGIIFKGETVRWYLEMHADNYYSKKPSIIEISWNGRWVEDQQQMGDYLKVIQLS